MVRELGYLGINSSDPGRWRDLLCEILGLQHVSGDDGSQHFFRMDSYYWRIAVRRSTSDDVAWLGWMVADRSELESLARRLDERGVRWRAGDRQEIAERKVTDLLVFEDPFGIRQEAFFGLLVNPEPFRPGRALSGFVTGDQGLGHAVIGVSSEAEWEAAMRFYSGVLGLRLSDFIDFEIGEQVIHGVFYHCNRRHHSLAIIQVPYAVEKRLRHFMLQVNSIDDVGFAYDLCLRRGEVTRTLGRHPNDRMISFYLRTPGGFEIEYGTGAITIDDEAAWVVQRYATASSWGHHRLETQPDLQRLVGTARGR